MRRDTVTTDKPDSSLKTDTIGQMVKSLQKFKHVRDTVDVRKVSLQPNLSLQQIVKGQLASVYVQEPSGEPGSVQSMIVQGASGVMFTKRDNYALQPAVYLNGVPMVQENPFAFDVQEYEYNRIGPATNLLSQIDMSNIQSIAVIKDPFELAKLGPNAANGAIYITTKNARAGVKDISLNAYYGFASTPKVYTTNGAYENAFRKQFFDKYATQQNYDDYAPYLRDSTNTAFFGPSNWNDLYYKNTPTYSADLGITGGNDRANFRFFGSGTKNANSADETSINRYNIFFGINMAPFKWLTVSSNVNAARLDRFGNRSLRDRYAEARYIPDLSTPLSPNAAVYGAYLQEFDKSVDNNRVTTLNGNLTLSAKIDKLTLTTSLLFDYNEGSRDYFTPSTLMDGISYISSYFGYNQRMIWNNAASYKFDFTPKSELQLEAGQTYQEDTYKYNYTRAYDGPSDFVKLNKVSATATGDDYLNSSAFGQVFRYIDKEANGLFSVYGSAKFKYEDLLTFSALVRRDGSSNGQPDNRWVTTPAFDVKYSLKNQFLKSNSTVNSLNFAAGWGQTVRTFLDDRYAAGPQYRTENGWDEEPTIPGYGPVLGMNRPYNSGFIGYNIKMPIAERTNINLDGSFFNNRLNASLTAYNRNDKNQLIGVPVSQESGYTQNYKSGLEVNNKGLELLLNASIIPQSKKIGWNTSANVNYNKNKVTALPDGYQDLISGENKIAVGKSIGSYWLYTNRGSYENESQIPTGMTFNGIPLKVGDPIWKDYNNDNRIDNKDKVMQGDRLPQFSGGWTNTLSYLKFDLTFNLVYAVGQKALNQYDSNRYGFINREASNDINSIREVSSWQRYDNEKSYTIYNPWSDVDPYRVDQDLFLEDASYLKLRSVTLGYDLTKAAFLSKSLAKIRRFYVYATAQNLWTLTNFSGADPELINYTGYYDGANISMPKTFVLGFKLDL
ncbi:SusC/RagA family TonB-linked outer membrane protein [Sphingobacterium multivorum]|uniref:SusC/RagA family TonB-linked outer membrane protein n=1 Tax=Sphingobacterium multivorum TaxID=28454 RepID=UPI002FDA9EB2